jgi:hypothetical protein
VGDGYNIIEIPFKKKGLLLPQPEIWDIIDPPGPPVPPTLDLCPEKIETTVILSNEIQRLPHLQRFGVLLLGHV